VRKRRGALAVTLGLILAAALAGGGCGGAPSGSRASGLTTGAGARAASAYEGGPAEAAAAALPLRGRVFFTRALEGPVVPGPVLTRDGSVLAASNGGVLHDLDPQTGADRWRFSGGSAYGNDVSTSPLVLDAGRLILWPGPRNTLFALAGSGRQLWSIQFGSQVLTPLRGPGSTVYVEEMDGMMRALRVGVGGASERWRVGVGTGSSYGSPASGAGGLVYTTVGRDLVAVRDLGSRGEVAWRFAAQDDIEVSPAVATDGTVVLGTNDRFEYGVSPTGQERWRWPRGVLTYSSPAATADGSVRFGDHRGRLITLRAASGQVEQVLQGHGEVWTRPAADAQGDTYWGTHAGELWGFDPSGRVVLHQRTGGSVESYPAVGQDATVYIGSQDGRVWAVRAAAR